MNNQIYIRPADICVCCGAPVPEGEMICWGCKEEESRA